MSDDSTPIAQSFYPPAKGKATSTSNAMPSAVPGPPPPPSPPALPYSDLPFPLNLAFGPDAAQEQPQTPIEQNLKQPAAEQPQTPIEENLEQPAAQQPPAAQQQQPQEQLPPPAAEQLQQQQVPPPAAQQQQQQKDLQQQQQQLAEASERAETTTAVAQARSAINELIEERNARRANFSPGAMFVIRFADWLWPQKLTEQYGHKRRDEWLEAPAEARTKLLANWRLALTWHSVIEWQCGNDPEPDWPGFQAAYGRPAIAEPAASTSIAAASTKIAAAAPAAAKVPLQSVKDEAAAESSLPDFGDDEDDVPTTDADVLWVVTPPSTASASSPAAPAASQSKAAPAASQPKAAPSPAAPAEQPAAREVATKASPLQEKQKAIDLRGVPQKAKPQGAQTTQLPQGPPKKAPPAPTADDAAAAAAGAAALAAFGREAAAAKASAAAPPANGKCPGGLGERVCCLESRQARLLARAG
jgi:hypothetical protein